MKVKFENGKFKVWADYNAQFVNAARKLAGKWNATSKSWDFDERNAELVRPVLFDFYGTDGESTPDTVSVKICFEEDFSKLTEPVTVCGRVIARAFGRDSGARLGDGIVMVSGSIDSGGSVKNWRTEISAGSVFIIHDFPRNRIQDIGFTVLEVIERAELPNAPVIDRDALREEKERILKRLAEIETILSSEIETIQNQEIPNDLKD